MITVLLSISALLPYLSTLGMSYIASFIIFLLILAIKNKHTLLQSRREMILKNQKQRKKMVARRRAQRRKIAAARRKVLFIRQKIFSLKRRFRNRNKNCNSSGSNSSDYVGDWSGNEIEHFVCNKGADINGYEQNVNTDTPYKPSTCSYADISEKASNFNHNCCRVQKSRYGHIFTTTMTDSDSVSAENRSSEDEGLWSLM